MKNRRKKNTVWCMKKCRKRHDAAQEKRQTRARFGDEDMPKKRDLACKEINKTCHGCCMRMWKKDFLGAKNGIIIFVFRRKIGKQKHELKHHLKLSGFFSECQPRGWRKQKRHLRRWAKKSAYLEIVRCDVWQSEIATVELDGRAL